jgi:hypothetical protein
MRGVSCHRPSNLRSNHVVPAVPVCDPSLRSMVVAHAHYTLIVLNEFAIMYSLLDSFPLHYTSPSSSSTRRTCRTRPTSSNSSHAREICRIRTSTPTSLRRSRPSALTRRRTNRLSPRSRTSSTSRYTARRTPRRSGHLRLAGNPQGLVQRSRVLYRLSS